ncbi:hypothetical protein M9H77_09003 [Catharanthus roseus]|uniref:Uncharacterized protein n=1 Tax=Catharanthus roseus TaxID=4058 RepID=A0ACC0BZB8_CATRO|nr:hypothetical protein M9H77_09003 [Catharanthus roseus]
MALIMRKCKRFYKKGFNNRGKKPPFKKGGQSSSLFKARCFEYNSIDHLVADCPKAIEKEKGALEAKLEALKKKKKKGKGLIGTWDQDSSENYDVLKKKGIFLGYSSNKKAFRIFNKRTLCVEEYWHSNELIIEA